MTLELKKLNRLYKSILGLSIVIVASFGIGSIIGSLELQAHALEYTDSELVMKDYDQMQQMVDKIMLQDLHMDDAEEAVRVKSKDAIVLVFSRRNTDGKLGELYRQIQVRLEDTDLSDVLDTVMTESIEALKAGTLTPAQKSTHFLILHNFIEQMKSPFKNASSMHADATRFLEKIRDAGISASDDVAVYRALKASRIENPSEEAKAILTNKK